MHGRAASRLMASAMVTIMALSALPLATSSWQAAAVTTEPSVPEDARRVVLVAASGTAEREALARSGASILAVYPSFVLAAAPAKLLATLVEDRVTELPDRELFRFGGRTLDLSDPDPEAVLPPALRLDSHPGGKGPYIVKFIGPVKEEWKRGVEGAGGRLFRPADPTSFIVRMGREEAAATRALPYVMWVGLYQPAYKLAPELLHDEAPAPAMVYTFPEDRERVAALVARLVHATARGALREEHFSGGPVPTHIAGGKVGLVEAELDSAQLALLARHPGVLFVEEFAPKLPLNDVAHSIVQSGGTTAVGAPASLVPGSYGATVPVWNQGLFGQGTVAGVADSGLRMDHNQFRNISGSNAAGPGHRKVVRYQTFPSTGFDGTYRVFCADHGTHVSATIAGYDNPVGGGSNNDGGAPGARLSFGDIDIESDCGANDYLEVPADYRDMWLPAVADGARSHSNSWGSGYVSFYSGDMFAIDDFAYENGLMLFTWAAGNSGPGPNTLGNQAQAKNAIAIGAQGRTSPPVSETAVNDVAGFSSRGPTWDGRRKPDVMAPGVQMNSASSAGTTGDTSMSGTSMATPNAQSAVAIMSQYFMEGWYPTGSKVAANAFNASHSLMKALLINGANEMTLASAYGNSQNFYPNDQQGWGRIHLDNSLYFAGEAVKLQLFDGDNGVFTGQYKEYRYRVTDTSVPLRVTLDWNDYPATIGSSTALVNNLDLLVTAPDGDTFKGNVLAGSNPGVSSKNVGLHDTANNVEGFRLPGGNADLIAGVWTVRVTGANVAVAPQQFAFVITGGLDLDFGAVQFDRRTYAPAETALVRVEDSGASSPVPVNVTSAMTGDYEVRSLTGGSGVFDGTVGFTLGWTPPNDGLLSVKNADTITASYDDPTGTPHVAIDTATIDAAGPAISNVRATVITDSAATIRFDTSEPARGRVHFGTTPSLGTSTAWSAGHRIAQSVDLGGLAPNTLYYYDVEAEDIYGQTVSDDASGLHYTFSTGVLGEILLVDASDNSNDFVPYYDDALRARGWSYNAWHVWRDGVPTLAKLQQYKAVIWKPVERYPQSSAAERALIKSYNDAGGRLWFDSQDIAWDTCASGTGCPGTEPDPSWLSTQLKATYQNDPTSFTSAVGIAADPISGAYTGGVTYNRLRDGGAGDEVNSAPAGGTATYVWRDLGGTATPDDIAVKWVSSASNGTPGVGVWGGTPSRVVSFFFESWRLNWVNGVYADAARTDIVDRTIQWLIGHDHPDVTVTAPTGGSTQTSSPVTVSWGRTTHGGTTVASQSIYHSPDGGQTWIWTADPSTAATSYMWDVTGLLSGNRYKVRVEVRDSGSPSPPPLNGSAETGMFTIALPGGDYLGPAVQAGSIGVSANPVTSPAGFTITATVDDSGRGDSDLDAAAPAEYSIVPAGNPAGAWTAMNLSSPPPSPTEVVTSTRPSTGFPPGSYDVWVRGRDAAGNVGPESKMTTPLTVIAAAPEAGSGSLLLAALLMVAAAGTWCFRPGSPRPDRGRARDRRTDGAPGQR